MCLAEEMLPKVGEQRLKQYRQDSLSTKDREAVDASQQVKYMFISIATTSLSMLFSSVVPFCP